MDRLKPVKPGVLDWMRQGLAAGVGGEGRLSGGLWLGAIDQPPRSGCLHLEGSVRKSTPAAARVYRSSDQVIANNASTQVIFDSVRFDTEGMWSASAPTRLTCRLAGVYLVCATLRWAVNPSGIRAVSLLLNGSLVICGTTTHTTNSGNTFTMSAATLYALDLGDFLEVQVYQSSGGNLNIAAVAAFSPEFAAARVV